VAIVDLLDEKGGELAAAIARAGGTARYWRADVARESDIRRVFREIAEAFGRIDVLVNNAGISGRTNRRTSSPKRSGTQSRM
jgi:NAD(P)-dependent dehydrogenase (short-subunit alcohol dehydrogenase family)